MFTCIKNKMRQFSKQGLIIFKGSEENYIRNGASVLEESISLFHGNTNALRHFSVDDLNNMNVNKQVCSYIKEGYEFYQGSFDGRVIWLAVLKRRLLNFWLFDLAVINPRLLNLCLRDVVVTTKMGTHNNVHKLLGCCLETECPVFIYEWLEIVSLEDRIIDKDGDQSKQLLEWKDRLRIAWEISHVVAYLHTAFPRPIIHRDLKPGSILLDENNSAKVGDFSLSISIPEGEEFVETDDVQWTLGHMDPNYVKTRKLSESTDVYSFGVLLLVLLTGKQAYCEQRQPLCVVDWVRNGVKDNIISDIVAPTITKNGVTTIEDLQLRASIQVALSCCASKPKSRPTIVEVATKLKNMITSPESIPT